MIDLKTENKKKLETKMPSSLKLNSIDLKKVNNKFEDKEIENICDENLTILQKLHAILLNCSNLSKKQKLEFCENERYFMKLYLKKLKENNPNI
ncbi:MAG: hypothetical protein ACFFCE_17355 [Promethearchaeota archaeon]